MLNKSTVHLVHIHSLCKYYFLYCAYTNIKQGLECRFYYSLICSYVQRQVDGIWIIIMMNAMSLLFLCAIQSLYTQNLVNNSLSHTQTITVLLYLYN